MLQITIPAVEASELWDEKNMQFIPIPARKEQALQLEHSLVSLSKWESKWCKPFFSKEEKTIDETLDYIRCMTINKNVDIDVYRYIDDETLKRITDYIYAPMTATTINEPKTARKKQQIVTSELIYYWMIANQIPFECEKWHLNRLITLIRVCNAENTPPKKTSKKELMSRYAAMNAANRKKFNSKG